MSLDASPDLWLGDVDGDGATDLLAIGAQLSVALADGRGGFGPLSRGPLELAPEEGHHVLFADFDGDGADEPVVAWWRGTQSELLQLRFDADARPSFIKIKKIADLPLSFARIRAADLDGDGALDLLASSGRTRFELFTLPGRGDGTFAAPRYTSFDDEVGLAATCDMDGDGRLDLVTVNQDGVFVFRGLGGGDFAAAQHWSSIGQRGVVAGDFDGDGRADLAIVGVDYALILVPGDGQAGGAPRLLIDGVTAVAAVDFDGDGRLELLAASGGPGRWRCTSATATATG